MVRTINKNVKNLKIDLKNKNFKGVIGSINPDSAEIFYIKLSFWCKHCDEIKNYKTNLNNLGKKIKNNLTILIKDVFETKLLFQLNGKKTLIRPDDIFYSNFEITLKQLPHKNNNIFQLKQDVELLINELIENYIISNNNFEFFYNKKGNYAD